MTLREDRYQERIELPLAGTVVQHRVEATAMRRSGGGAHAAKPSSFRAVNAA